MRIPVDVVASLKQIAPHKGFTWYQTLLKSYISEGLRRDETEARCTGGGAGRGGAGSGGNLKRVAFPLPADILMQNHIGGNLPS